MPSTFPASDLLDSYVVWSPGSSYQAQPCDYVHRVPVDFHAPLSVEGRSIPTCASVPVVLGAT